MKGDIYGYRNFIKMMKIDLVGGTGNIGVGLARRAYPSGMYDVMIGSRYAEANKSYLVSGFLMTCFSEHTCVVTTCTGETNVDVFNRDTIILSFLFEWIVRIIGIAILALQILLSKLAKTFIDFTGVIVGRWMELDNPVVICEDDFATRWAVMDMIVNVSVSKFQLLGGDPFAISGIVECITPPTITLSLNTYFEKFRIFLDFLDDCAVKTTLMKMLVSIYAINISETTEEL
ncbi:MAG: hypothetical protein LBH02_01120 [Methanocalculaceae archaeon]|jgi:hypothetical protein|nr:hypothetical protein [Methanocalculaceae archaeon]